MNQRSTRTGITRTHLVAAIVLLGLGQAATASARQIPPAAGITEAHAATGAAEGPLRAAVRREPVRMAQGPVQTAPQQAGWIARHPVAVGALIGTGVGAALSRVEAIGGADRDPRVTLIGTGVGAWSGLIASAVQKRRAGQKVGPGTKIGIAAGAVAAVVVPILACYGAGGCGGSS